MDAYSRGPLHFDVDDLGPPDGDAVILLHGFPQDRTAWSAVTPALIAAGYRVLAPDQRGYSPGARPAGRRSYRLDLLAGDVTALADAAALASFHVVGHDWGAAVAWHLAAAAPGRVRTLTAISVPHPRAIAAAERSFDQARRSWYMLAFQVPGAGTVLSARSGRVLREALRRGGLAAEPAARYAGRLADPAAARAAINWYRALPWSPPGGTPAVTVPTLQLWGPEDPYVGRGAIAANPRWVDAAYRLVELPGGHWLPESQPAAVAEHVLQHLADNR